MAHRRGPTRTDWGRSSLGHERRRHLPFAAFLGLLAIATTWLQFNLAPFATTLLSLHVLFQIVLGATAVAILRNVVGLKTYGTFGAVIVASAMVVAGALLGFLLFAFMLLAVVLVRAALAGEAVQESHRVAILVTVVAMTAAAGTVLGAFSLAPGFAYAALFPILITAWLAERFVEEIVRVGWYPGLRTLALTVVSVVVAYVVMIQTPVVAFVVLNPVTWTGIVILNWLLGTRVRFRISERFRFRGTKSGDESGLGGSVLSMNLRNREFIDRYNPPALLASLDKARVKELLVPEGIPMPRTYLYVRGRRDLSQARDVLERLQRVAIKPASAYGGEGILLVRGRDNGRFRVNGHLEATDEIVRHIQRIVDGEFNEGRPDVAILEELLEPNPRLKPLTPEGVADIRVVCLLGHPVMAMARLPTRMSRGRANLHAGAVGAGIDLSTGRLTNAVWNGVRVAVHPDTGVAFEGFQVPQWRSILEIAAEAQLSSGLGFAGVDIVLDARHGPVVLEINRRPGLEIQNANREGLLPRLRAIEALAPTVVPTERRVQISLDLNAIGWRPGRSGLMPSPPPGIAPPMSGS